MKNETTIRNCVLGFQCKQKWDALILTDIQNVRFCNACRREVHFCDTDEKLADAVKADRCVAFERIVGEIRTMFVGSLEGDQP